MLKLIVLAKMRVTETAQINSTAVAEDVAFTFNTNCVFEWTTTGMNRQAFPSVTHKGFTKVTDSTNHPHSSGKHCMFNDTVSSLAHAFLFSALSTHRKSLNVRAEVAECSRLLLSLALITLHRRIAWRKKRKVQIVAGLCGCVQTTRLNKINLTWIFCDIFLLIPDLLLSELLLLRLFTLASLLLRHDYVVIWI